MAIERFQPRAPCATSVQLGLERVDYCILARQHPVRMSADSISRLPRSVLTKIQGYFDLDWSYRHVVCTCAVSRVIIVYEILLVKIKPQNFQFLHNASS